MKLCNLVSLACSLFLIGNGGAGSAGSSDPGQYPSGHEKIVLERIAKHEIIVVGCLFAIDRNQLSPEKYEVVKEYSVVRVFKGRLHFGAKFKVVSLVEGSLSEAPNLTKSILGDFHLLALFDKTQPEAPFEAVHALPYSKNLVDGMARLLGHR